MSWRVRIGLGLVAASLLACGPKIQPVRVAKQDVDEHRDGVSEEAVELVVKRHARLLSVSHRLQLAGKPECGESVGPVQGYVAWKADDRYFESFSHALERLYAIRDGDLAVVAIEPGSAAARAGLLVRDQLLRVGGKKTTKEHEVYDHAYDVESGPVSVSVLRNGEPLTLKLDREIGCRSGVTLAAAHDVIGTWPWEDHHVQVTMGMLRFAQSDDELAFAIAHEMAHHLLPVSVVTSPEREVEADEIGLRIVFRAGYDIGAAPGFWERLAVEQVWSVHWDTATLRQHRFPPHGSMAHRTLALPVLVDRVRQTVTTANPR